MSRPFRYFMDPLCLLGGVNYAVSRWILIPNGSMPRWWTSHWHDFWMIPVALPLILFMHRLFKWRDHDRFPSGMEIFGHFAIWSLISEWIGPIYFARGTADWKDVVAYGVGALFAWFWWRFISSKKLRNQAELIDNS